jgi:hypothetical protein
VGVQAVMDEKTNVEGLSVVDVGPALARYRRRQGRLHQIGQQRKAYARAVSGLYNWAIEHDLVPPTCQPCAKLGKLKEQPRERFLSEAEIRTLWHASHSSSPWRS